MAIDPSRITSNNNMVFTPGEIVFAISVLRFVTATIVEQPGVTIIGERVRRSVLVRHAVALMRNALGVREGLYIEIDTPLELPHCGLGSSSGLIGAVAAAINELYGCPLSDDVLIRYLAQNHGEETEGDQEHLIPVQCIGGSAAAGLHTGGLLVLTGESTVIASMDVDPKYRVVIGVPTDSVARDAAALMELEIQQFPRFLETGQRYGPQIAFAILHFGLPAMVRGDLGPIGDIVYEYRFNMGSIENCSFVHPCLLKIAARVRTLKDRGLAAVLSLSSVGPAFFAVTTNIDECKQEFAASGMRCFEVTVYNSRYRVVASKH